MNEAPEMNLIVKIPVYLAGPAEASPPSPYDLIMAKVKFTTLHLVLPDYAVGLSQKNEGC